MKKLLSGVMVVGLLGGLVVGKSFAAVPEIVGGVRDGAAIGLQLESGIAKNLTLRGGLEFDSGSQPVIGCLGVKLPLSAIGRMPLALGLGVVGYFGNGHNDAGVALSFIFSRFFDVQPLFLELGVDVAGQGRLQAQLGYKIY